MRRRDHLDETPTRDRPDETPTRDRPDETPTRDRPGVPRRTFLQGLAAGAAAAAAGRALGATSPAGAAADPAKGEPAKGAPAKDPAAGGDPPTEPAAPRSKVYLVRTADRAEGVRKVVALAGLPDLAGRRVVIKPNFNSADPAPGSTHPDVLRTLVTLLKGAGPRSLTVAERSGMGDTRRVLEEAGVLALAKEQGFEAVVLDELPAKAWKMIQPEGSHWKEGFPFARVFLDADIVVQACCLKTHRFGGEFTLSLKNSVGMVAKYVPGREKNFMSELHGSPHQRKMIAEINAAYAPALVVMDGVEAFASGGPEQGRRVAAKVVLASTDRVAIDAVGVAILRLYGTTPAVSEGAIFAQDQLARAVELGLGASGPGAIELVTSDDESRAFAGRIREVLDA